MARKSRVTAGRRSARKRGAAAKVPNTVGSILAECEAEVNRGLGDMPQSKEAHRYWDGLYRRTIKKQLDKGDTWDLDKVRVLRVAFKLGKIAADLTSEKSVQLWAAQAASEAVWHDPSCPSLGEGGYCDPSARGKSRKRRGGRK